MGEYVLEMKGISKAFPGVQALNNVDLRIKPKMVHAVMGENGAGKSTLMKCLLGIYQRDAGDVILKGEKVDIKNPADARDKGIAMIQQELNPIPLRSVCDNLWVGREIKKAGFLDQKRMMKESKEILHRLEIDVDPATRMGTLSVAQMQMVEIARAVSYNADIIIMDEPTSALTESETQKLFKVINQLKEEGKSIVYISHKMDEIFAICDEVSVYRDGEYVGQDLIENFDEDRLIKMMVGREVTNIFPKIECDIGDVVLKAENLSDGKHFNNISFELHAGEILGFAGLVGAGRTEVCEAIFGIRHLKNGKIYINGEEVKIKSAEEAIARGLGMVTEDRRGSGIIPVASVLNNISIANLKVYQNKFRKLNNKKIKADAQKYGDKLNIKMPNYYAQIKNLSGGNQQKVIVARWLLTNPSILIVDEPTRGIDVGAKASIHEIITNLAAEGKAIILISSELPEVMGMSDRIIVMHEGKQTGIIERKDFTQEKIMAYATKV